MEIKKIACLGSGVIGASWAVCFSQHDYDVVIYDIKEEFLETAKSNIRTMFENLAQYDGINAADIPKFEARISFTTSMEEAVKDAQFVQENVPENIDIKWQVIEEYEKYAPTDAIFASSTSGMLISDIAKKAKHPERFVGAHPYNPPHLIPLVELASGDKTDPACVQVAKEFYLACKKVPVILMKEAPGFISNRIQQAVIREMCELVMRGVCTVEDANNAVTFGPGIRWGVMGPLLIARLGAGRDGKGFSHPGFKAAIESWLNDMADWKSYPEEWSAEVMPKGVAEEMANRSPELGNDYDSLAAYRDKMLIGLLKMHGKL